MNKNNTLLNRSEVIFMFFGGMVGVAILSLPNEAAKIAHEDAWISVMLGGIHPIYMIALMAFFSRKFPQDDVLTLNKKYFGKYIGNALNLSLFTFFIYIAAAVCSGYNNIIRTFVEGFLPSYKILIVLIILSAYACGKGLKVVAKTSVIIFYITLIIFISPLPALKSASVINIMPIGKTGISSILKACKSTVFAYQGSEIMFLIYPLVQEKKTLIKDFFIGLFITVLMYTWVTFISIYYLGADIVIKSYWPFLTVTESVTVSIVNNFRYIFMVLWTLSVFKVITNYHYLAIHTIHSYVKKVDLKIISCIIAPIILIVALKFSNVIERGEMLPKISMYYLIFNTASLTALAVIIFIKEGIKR